VIVAVAEGNASPWPGFLIVMVGGLFVIFKYKWLTAVAIKSINDGIKQLHLPHSLLLGRRRQMVYRISCLVMGIILFATSALYFIDLFFTLLCKQ